MDDRDYEAMNKHNYGNDFIADVSHSMTDLEKTLHIEFGQLIDKMNNGLIHPHTTRMKLVEKAMEIFALYNVGCCTVNNREC